MTTADILGPLLTLVILAGILLGCWAIQSHQDRMAADRRERNEFRRRQDEASARDMTRSWR